MKKWKQLIMAFALVAGVSTAVAPTSSVFAINVFDGCGNGGNGNAAVCKAAGTDNATSMTTNIINTMLFILGILTVIMIIFGGIRYVTSAGDASKVKAAKDTVLYSVVGLVVAILSYAIVNFVVVSI